MCNLTLSPSIIFLLNASSDANGETVSFFVNPKDKMNFFIDFIKDQHESGKHILYTIKDATRSDRQNNAMHLWFRQIAEELNDAGYWVRHPFSDSLEIPFTEILVKEMLYKPIIKAMETAGLIEISQQQSVAFRTHRLSAYAPSVGCS